MKHYLFAHLDKDAGVEATICIHERPLSRSVEIILANRTTTNRLTIDKPEDNDFYQLALGSLGRLSKMAGDLGLEPQALTRLTRHINRELMHLSNPNFF